MLEDTITTLVGIYSAIWLLTTVAASARRTTTFGIWYLLPVLYFPVKDVALFFWLTIESPKLMANFKVK